MIAPIDATATFDAEGETITLAMNFRTIALAEDKAAGAMTGFTGGEPKMSGMTALVWAFAQPAHPTLTLDQALALVVRHGEAAGSALRAVFAKAASVEPPVAGPRGPARKTKA